MVVLGAVCDLVTLLDVPVGVVLRDNSARECFGDLLPTRREVREVYGDGAERGGPGSDEEALQTLVLHPHSPHVREIGKNERAFRALLDYALDSLHGKHDAYGNKLRHGRFNFNHDNDATESLADIRECPKHVQRTLRRALAQRIVLRGR